MVESLIEKLRANDRIFSLIAAFISGSAMVLFLGMSTTNIISLVMLILLYQMYRSRARITDKKIALASYVCGAFYTVAFYFVKVESLAGDERTVFAFFSGLVYIIGFYLMFSSLTAVIFDKLRNVEFCSNNTGNVARKELLLFFILCVCIILICWLPYFLRNYPGDVTTDSSNQLVQVVGTAPLAEANPIAHTMMIKLFYSLGMALFNDQTKAVATYSVCQQILLASAFAYLLTTMYKFKVKIPVILTALAFYSIIPYHAIYSITMWKDIPFGASVVVLSTTVWRLFRHFSDKEPKVPVFDSIMLLIFGVAMCLFRLNGIYAYVLLIPFLFLVFFKKSKLPAVMASAALLIAILIKGPIYSSITSASYQQVYNQVPNQNSIQVMIPGIPAQQIAYVIKSKGLSALTYKEYELLSNIVVVEYIPETYVPWLSDPIVLLVYESNNLEYYAEHKGEFLKLWLRIGLRNPAAYIGAYVNQTYGYWYPDVQNWVYSAEFIGDREGYHIEKDMKLPETANKFLTDFMECYHDIPYLGLLWSIGTVSWVCIFMSGLCIIKQGKSYFMIYVPVLAILATLMLATPVFSDFRYMYSAFATVPLFCVAPFCSFKGKETPEKIPVAPNDASEDS